MIHIIQWEIGILCTDGWTCVIKMNTNTPIYVNNFNALKGNKTTGSVVILQNIKNTSTL